jgi:hypothetical protein
MKAPYGRRASSFRFKDVLHKASLLRNSPLTSKLGMNRRDRSILPLALSFPLTLVAFSTVLAQAPHATVTHDKTMGQLEVVATFNDPMPTGVCLVDESHLRKLSPVGQ